MKLSVVLVGCVLLVGCMTPTPRHADNICKVFQERPEWYAKARASEKRWQVPLTTQMAIMHQESKFDANARPKRTKLLGFVPWRRPSTAYGYAQALDTTWDYYKRLRGKPFASRTSFSDSIDFVGWYTHRAHVRAGIPPADTFAMYLAYHEGIGGYQRRTYRKKRWLVQVAKKVRLRAGIYDAQLRHCEARLHRRKWLGVF